MHFDSLESTEESRPVEETWGDEVCYELCLQLAENLADMGATEFSREVRTNDVRWLVKVVRA